MPSDILHKKNQVILVEIVKFPPVFEEGMYAVKLLPSFNPIEYRNFRRISK